MAAPHACHFRSWRSDWRGLRLGCDQATQLPYSRLKRRLHRCLSSNAAHGCNVTDFLPLQVDTKAERRALQDLCSLLGEPELCPSLPRGSTWRRRWQACGLLTQYRSNMSNVGVDPINFI